MKKNSENLKYHIGYWIIVLTVLTQIFGSSWGNRGAAFFFVSMLLPIVIGTSYFFNYVLVPKFYLNKRYLRFTVYSFYTAIISLHFEIIVLLLSFIYLENFNFKNLNPNATDVFILAIILYLLVFVGSFLLMVSQIKEHRQAIQELMEDKEKMKMSFLEIVSKRRKTKIPYQNIIYIESLADYIKVITTDSEVISKEKISHLAERLPNIFMRIHRSFIINTERIKERTFDEVLVDDVRLNIGRSYRKEVKEKLEG